MPGLIIALMSRPVAAELPSLWQLDPSVTFLNHGSFGACPREVLEFQQTLQRQMERQPVRFLAREMEERLDAARNELGEFVGAEAEDLVFVRNATEGVNAVLRSLVSAAGDELITTDHAYNACRNVLDFVAAKAGAVVRVAKVPFPIARSEQVVDAILEQVTRRTKLVLIDHVTSSTGLIFPVDRIVAEMASRNIEVLIDGAHAPGMLALNLSKLGAGGYTGNLHKWVCAPKGAAFLHVRRDLQSRVRPTSISHGANSQRTDRERFRIEFDWTGTLDPTAWLTVPEAIRSMDSLLPGGWGEVMNRNRALALSARTELCGALKIEAPSPDEMIGSLAAVPLPDSPAAGSGPLFIDPLQDALLERYSIEVPIFAWPRFPNRVLRISAQLYNTPHDYRRLSVALGELLDQ